VDCKRGRDDRGCKARLGRLDCMFEVAGWFGRKGWGGRRGPRRGRVVPRVGDRRLRKGKTIGKGY
jgi:hypothetical protein